jgi:uncharacterized protein YaaN involved in tellurite resistance
MNQNEYQTKPKSPFGSIKTHEPTQPIVATQPDIAPSPFSRNVAVVDAGSKLGEVKSLIRDEDVSALGANLSRKVGATTEKIIQKIGVSNFGELGAMLVAVQSEADKLSPDSLKKKGIIGWFQSRYGNIKNELTVRLKNADAVFDNLSQKIAEHITRQEEWVRDIDLLYKENYDRYNDIIAVMAQADAYKKSIQTQLDNWETIDANDPNAMMKAHQRREVESRLNRIKIKYDSFMRLKVVTENNAPKLQQQQDTSRTTIMALKDVIEQTIPLIKMEFTMYIQSLDAQKSIQIVNNANGLANKTMKTSADTAKQSALDATEALNKPIIETETLDHIRNRMLETLSGVREIQDRCDSQRVIDEAIIRKSQEEYLNVLQETKTLN